MKANTDPTPTRDQEQVDRLNSHLHSFELGTFFLFGGLLLGGLVAWWSTRRLNARWTWAFVWLFAVLEVCPVVISVLHGSAAVYVCIFLGATAVGYSAIAARLTINDYQAGGDRAHEARERVGPWNLLNRWMGSKGGIVAGRWPEMEIGSTKRGEMAAIKRGVGVESGSHRFVIGATGSGKSTLLGVLALEGAAKASAVVMVEGKIDHGLEKQARLAAQTVGRDFVLVSPEGGHVWDMLATGNDDETVAKLMACEEYTEPHYEAQALRIMRWAVRVGGAHDEPLGLRRVMDLCEPERLATTAATIGNPVLANEVESFTSGLSPRERADVSGLRSRLAVLAESDFGGSWLDPASQAGPLLDLDRAIRDRAVIYFRLDAERLGVVAEKVGAAITISLGAIASSLQRSPIPTTICIDEFSAIPSEHVDRLFTRGRGAGFSVTVATHTLADLRVAGEAVEDRVKATVESVLSFRVGPDDADAIARIAGQVGTDQRTTKTQGALGMLSQAGTRTRGYRLRIHPSVLQHLGWGECAVIRLDRKDDKRVQIARVVPAWERDKVEVWPVVEDAD